MPSYTYRCPQCGFPHTEITTIDGYSLITMPICPGCSIPMKRDYRIDSPKPASIYPEHFNPAVGRVVRSERDFANALRQGAEESTAFTGGIPHSYVPIHPSEAPGAAQAQEAQSRVLVESGVREAKKWHHS